MNHGEYYLFWDEDTNQYFLYGQGKKLIGRLPDDTVFANKVLSAFNAEEKFERLKTNLEHIKSNIDFHIESLKNQFEGII
jgi:hypothetical protein